MQQTHKNNTTSQGFTMKGFFKGCGCVGGGELDKSHSSISDRRPMLNKNQAADFDTYSASNAEEWTDLEEMQVIPDGNGDIDHFLNFDGPDVYETLEPIDFNSLEHLTGESEEEIKSQHSGLSRSSKKINKNEKKPKKTEKKQSSSNASPQKGSKPRGKRNPWQPHEDAKLLELVAKHGQSWSVLSTLIEGRTGKQIRDRYMNILRPNVKKGDWTPQEDQQILSLYYTFGRKWSKISSYVPGRTEGQVKNRFYAHIQKKILNIDDKPESPTEEISPELPTKSTKKSVAMSSKTAPSNQEANYSPQIYSQASPQDGTRPPYHFPTHKDDPTDVISYEGSPGRYQRGGSNENFIDPTDTEASIGVPSPNKAGKMDFQMNNVDDLLDKVAVYFEKGMSSRQVPVQDGYTNNGFGDNGFGSFGNSAPDFMETFNTPDGMDKMTILQKRRSNLEFLLLKTMQEMNACNASSSN